MTKEYPQYESDYTSQKQEHLIKFIKYWDTVFMQVAKDKPLPVLFIDANAGTGYSNDGKYRGSATLIVEYARKLSVYPQFKNRVSVILCEYDNESYNQLRRNIEPLSNNSFKLWFRHDNRRLYHDINQHFRSIDLSRTYGFVYHDPNPSADDINEGILSLFHYESSKLDFACYLHATQYKRMLKANHVPQVNKRIGERLQEVKDYWYMTPLQTAQQKVFLCGFNYPFREWRGAGFHYYRSNEGRNNWERMNKTKSELNDDQPRLF